MFVKENCKIDGFESIYDDILYWQDGRLISNIGEQETEALEVRLQIDADMLNVLKGFETIEVCET
jgi:hypothetical protein